MTRDDRPKDPPDDADARDADPDRAAILARRRRFVAIALSGLATGAGCPAKPEPCLSAAPVDGNSLPPATPDEPGPQACLKIANPDPIPVEPVPAPNPDPEPAACLKVAPPREPPPQPCLSVAPARPRPCLKVAAPRDPEPERPPPSPCLRVAKPE